MTNTILAIGPVSDLDRGRMEAEFDVIFLAEPVEVSTLAASDKEKIVVVAYMGFLPFGEAEISQFANLKLIANFGVGYDAIDVDVASKRGIAVTNTPDVLNEDVADLAVAMLLMQLRQMRQADEHVRSGKWDQGQQFPYTRKLADSKVGILGMGRIGRDIADRLAAFNTKIHYQSRSRKDTPAGWTYHADVVSLAKAVDILVLAIVGGADTKNLVSTDVLDALGPKGILINIARGSVVDEPALLDALENGNIAGAGLDVFWNEPHIDQRFLKLENVVLQPHVASATHETRADMGQLQRDNIHAFFQGKPLLTQVN